jgi:hypothetical protein
MDLVIDDCSAVLTHRPSVGLNTSEEEQFLREVGETFLLVGTLPDGWEEALSARLQSTKFARPPERDRPPATVVAAGPASMTEVSGAATLSR